MRLLITGFFLIFSIFSFSQPRYFKLCKNARLVETPEPITLNHRVKKGEMLQILSYENGYLKVKNQGMEGYILLFPNSFKDDSAHEVINKKKYLYKHKEIMERLGLSRIPYENDNSIIIQSNIKADECYKSFGSYLVSNGFIFSQKDADFTNLVTNPKILGIEGKDKVRYRLLVFITDNQIKIKIEYDDLVSILLKGNIEVEYFKSWYYKPEYKKSKNLIFSDIAPIIEGFKYDYEYMNEP